MDLVDIVFAALLAAWFAACGFVIWTDRHARREAAEIAAMSRARRSEPG